MPRTRLLLALLALVALMATLAACGDDEGDEAEQAATGTIETGVHARTTSTRSSAGVLTVGTDKPAFPPYFVDDDPTNGQGFESAVAYAIADRLGFADSRGQRGSSVPFNSSYAPGPKKFDFDINQISITPQRARAGGLLRAVLHDARRRSWCRRGSPYASATSVAELKEAQFGVQVGTTSLDALESVIDPSQQPQVFNDSNDTVRALKSKQVDAIVVDLPTAIYLRDVEVEGSKVVGQFPAPGGDDWGVVLAKGSRADAVRGRGDRRDARLGRARPDHRAVDRRRGAGAGAGVGRRPGDGGRPPPLTTAAERRVAREAARRRHARRGTVVAALSTVIVLGGLAALDRHAARAGRTCSRRSSTGTSSWSRSPPSRAASGST